MEHPATVVGAYLSGIKAGRALHQRQKNKRSKQSHIPPEPSTAPASALSSKRQAATTGTGPPASASIVAAPTRKAPLSARAARAAAPRAPPASRVAADVARPTAPAKAAAVASSSPPQPSSTEAGRDVVRREGGRDRQPSARGAAATAAAAARVATSSSTRLDGGRSSDIDRSGVRDSARDSARASASGGSSSHGLAGAKAVAQPAAKVAAAASSYRGTGYRGGTSARRAKGTESDGGGVAGAEGRRSRHADGVGVVERAAARRAARDDQI